MTTTDLFVKAVDTLAVLIEAANDATDAAGLVHDAIEIAVDRALADDDATKFADMLALYADGGV